MQRAPGQQFRRSFYSLREQSPAAYRAFHLSCASRNQEKMQTGFRIKSGMTIQEDFGVFVYAVIGYSKKDNAYMTQPGDK